MDVDLSTNLASFLPLVTPLIAGKVDIAIGSRLRHGAVVTRQWKREVLSRAYNALIRALFGNRFSDAQCGFKALTRTAAQELLPAVEDNAWFFDTELLLAEARGYRIHEVPVEWVEDLDSRVDIVKTVLADVKGLWRMRFRRYRWRRRSSIPSAIRVRPWSCDGCASGHAVFTRLRSLLLTEAALLVLIVFHCA